MLKWIAVSMGFCLILGAFAPAPFLASQNQKFVIIVNGKNPTTSLTRAELAQIFLKQNTRWPGSKLVAEPVDLPKRSPVREVFSKTILSRSVASVGTYWQQQIFSGKAVPPPEKPNDVNVVAFVRSHEGAVGYVAVGTDLGFGVKTVTVK